MTLIKRCEMELEVAQLQLKMKVFNGSFQNGQGQTGTGQVQWFGGEVREEKLQGRVKRGRTQTFRGCSEGGDADDWCDR